MSEVGFEPTPPGEIAGIMVLQEGGRIKKELLHIKRLFS